MEHYVLALLFRYVMGIPDPADRNFILVHDLIYSCDEEGFGRETNYQSALKERKCEHIKNYIRAEWTKLQPILTKWLDKVRDNEDTVKNILDVDDISWFLTRLEFVQRMNNVCNIF